MENDPALSRTGKLKTIRSRKEKSQRVYNCKTRTVKGKRHQPQVRGSRCIEVDVTSTSIDERLKEPKILWEFKGVKERKYSSKENLSENSLNLLPAVDSKRKNNNICTSPDIGSTVEVIERKQKRKKRDWPTPNCSPSTSLHALNINTVRVEDVETMNLEELHNLMRVLDLKWKSKFNKDELRRRIVSHLDWRKKRTFKKSADASHWSPPGDLPNLLEVNEIASQGARGTEMAMEKSVSSSCKPDCRATAVSPILGGSQTNTSDGNSNVLQHVPKPFVTKSVSVRENTHTPHTRPDITLQTENLLTLVQNLKEEIRSLKSGLKKSEDIRHDMELRMAELLKEDGDDIFAKVLALDSTRVIYDRDDEMGLLWNLSRERESLRMLDEHLAKLDHSSRCAGEHPVVILSERRLEMVSFPFDGDVKVPVEVMNRALNVNSNMIGHMVLSQDEVEVTAGFAGAKGNLIWFNTGGCDLLLRLKTEEVTQSIILEQGFGFCLGKREKFTRVFISSVNRAVDLFAEDEIVDSIPRAMFFGCDSGDSKTWLGKLNADTPAKEFKKSVGLRGGGCKIDPLEETDRNQRLGILFKNHKRNQIRIAPMRDSKLKPNVLPGKIAEVEKWVRDTLRGVKSVAMPNTFSVTPKKEHSQGSESFDVL